MKQKRHWQNLKIHGCVLCVSCVFHVYQYMMYSKILVNGIDCFECFLVMELLNLTRQRVLDKYGSHLVYAACFLQL